MILFTILQISGLIVAFTFACNKEFPVYKCAKALFIKYYLCHNKEKIWIPILFKLKGLLFYIFSKKKP